MSFKSPVGRNAVEIARQVRMSSDGPTTPAANGNTTLLYHVVRTIDGYAGVKGLGALADAWQEPRSDVSLVGRRAIFVDELTVAFVGKRVRAACYLPN